MKANEKFVNVSLDLIAEKVCEIKSENNLPKLTAILVFLGDVLEPEDSKYVARLVRDYRQEEV